jgi:hypothetical protein
MTRRRLNLAAWTGLPQNPDRPRLTLADVLYSPPNPDMTRKRCGNCVLWLGARGDGETPVREECFIHAADVMVVENMVCGYHVYGIPMGGDVPLRESMAPVTPEFSGLSQPEDGASCELCAHWRATMGARAGTCAVAFEDDTDGDGDPIPATVQPNGCCAAWQALDEQEG